MDPISGLDPLLQASSAPKKPSKKTSEGAIDERERAKLEKACRDFEGIFLADLWKTMMKSARAFGAEDKRTYAILEDVAVEMSSESLSEGEGVGLWKILYSQLVASLPDRDEAGEDDEGRHGQRDLRDNAKEL